MLDYIRKQLLTTTELPVHNILHNIISDSILRQKITYNSSSGKYEFPISELSHNVITILKDNRIGYYEKNLKGTDIFIQIWNDKISFWLKK